MEEPQKATKKPRSKSTSVVLAIPVKFTTSSKWVNETEKMRDAKEPKKVKKKAPYLENRAHALAPTTSGVATWEWVRTKVPTQL